MPQANVIGSVTDLDINVHRETWPIRVKGFRRWLAQRFFEQTGGAPSSETAHSRTQSDLDGGGLQNGRIGPVSMKS